MNKCVICGKEFKPKKNAKGLCCSLECSIAYSKKNFTRELKTSVCQYCGKEFIIKRTYLKGRFCSHECQIASLKKAKEERIQAKVKKKAIKKFETALKKVAKNKQFIINHTRHCIECGKEFVSIGGTGFCSDKCRKRNHNRKHQHRLDKCKIKDGSITLEKLYQRDRGTCQICGKHLTFDCYFNSGDYPSIDHIIPIAKGGNHTWANVQLACRKCNSEKSDSIV